jgi:hypothetical protein
VAASAAKGVAVKVSVTVSLVPIHSLRFIFVSSCGLVVRLQWMQFRASVLICILQIFLGLMRHEHEFRSG